VHTGIALAGFTGWGVEREFAEEIWAPANFGVQTDLSVVLLHDVPATSWESVRPQKPRRLPGLLTQFDSLSLDVTGQTGANSSGPAAPPVSPLVLGAEFPPKQRKPTQMDFWPEGVCV